MVERCYFKNKQNWVEKAVQVEFSKIFNKLYPKRNYKVSVEETSDIKEKLFKKINKWDDVRLFKYHFNRLKKRLKEDLKYYDLNFYLTRHITAKKKVGKMFLEDLESSNKELKKLLKDVE